MASLFLNFIPDEALQAICRTLLHSLWQGILAAALAGLVMLSTRRASARLRYYGLLSVFVVFLAGVAITLCSQWPAASSVEAVGKSNAELVLIMPGIKEEIRAQAPTMVSEMIGFCNQYAIVIFFSWGLICLYKCSRIMVGLHGLQRMRSSQNQPVPETWQGRFADLKQTLGVGRTVELLESALVKVPVAIGFLKPVILLPAGFFTRLSPAQVEAILLHELAHIRRADYLVNLLQNMAECLFFFNPAMLWISSLIREEREACCDDMVLACNGDRQEYVEALVSFQEYSSHHSLAMGIGGKKMFLLQRVKRLLIGENNNLGMKEKLLLVLGLVLVTAFTFIPQHSRNSKSSSPEKLNSMGRHTMAAAPAFLRDTIPAKISEKPAFSRVNVDRNTKTLEIKVSAKDQHGNYYEVLDKNDGSPRFFVNEQPQAFDDLKQYPALYEEYHANRNFVVEVPQLVLDKPVIETKQMTVLDAKMPKKVVIEAKDAVVETEQFRIQASKFELNYDFPVQQKIELKNKLQSQPKFETRIDSKESLLEIKKAKTQLIFQNKLKVDLKLDTIPDTKVTPSVKVSPVTLEVKPSLEIKPLKTSFDFKSFINDLVVEHVVVKSSEVKLIKIDAKSLEVNGLVQPVELHAKLKAKYNIETAVKVTIDGGLSSEPVKAKE